MRIRLVCFGRLAPRSLQPAVEEYAQRWRRLCRFEIDEIPEEKGPGALEREAALVRRRWEGASARLCLDSRGKAWSSEQWAQALEGWRRGSPDVALAIGSADGLHPDLVREAIPVSLGPATLPHSLARLVVLEQLYRAHTQVLGHPYHLGH
jgi:23S rRNA (pseudouridine1915-N3)-methyltransferase